MKFLTLAIAALAATSVFADEAVADEAPQAAPDQQMQLRRNLHQMRQIIEQEDAQADAVTRGNTHPLQMVSADTPGISQMRDNISRQLERLEDRCFGMENKVNGGNLIVICGDNSGRADNSNIRTSSDTNIILPPPPPPPAAEQPAAEAPQPAPQPKPAE